MNAIALVVADKRARCRSGAKSRVGTAEQVACTRAFAPQFPVYKKEPGAARSDALISWKISDFQVLKDPLAREAFSRLAGV